ncbi:hypothetical protein KDM41_12370 [bacterium]|nr:hypothetical protein [bacterium]
MMRYDTVLRSLILTTALALAGTVVAAPAAHEAASCKQCHIGTSEAGGKAPNSRCTGCHGAAGRPADAGPDFGFHRDAGRACVDCHSFHTPETMLTAAGPLDLAGARQADPAHCFACHAAGLDRSKLNGAHLQAAAVYHAKGADLHGESPSRGCLNCHDQGSDSAWMAATEETPLTFATHASHPIDVLVRPGSGWGARRLREEIDPRIPLFDGRLACQSCHDITAETKDLVRAIPTPKALCLGCHEVGPAASPDRPAAAPLLAVRN